MFEGWKEVNGALITSGESHPENDYKPPIPRQRSHPEGRMHSLSSVIIFPFAFREWFKYHPVDPNFWGQNPSKTFPTLASISSQMLSRTLYSAWKSLNIRVYSLKQNLSACHAIHSPIHMTGATMNKLISAHLLLGTADSWSEQWPSLLSYLIYLIFPHSPKVSPGDIILGLSSLLSPYDVYRY